MINFGRDGTTYVILDVAAGMQIRLDREELKELSRFFLVELNIVDALISDGRNLLDFDSKFRKMVLAKFSTEEIQNAAKKAEIRGRGN